MYDRDTHFKNVSGVYTQYRDTDQIVVDTIVNLINNNQETNNHNPKVVDIATGTGRYLSLLSQSLNSDSSIYGLDISFPMLSSANGHLKDTVELINGDIYTLPFKNSFDAVLIMNAIHHVDLSECAQSVKSSLKPDGLFLIYTRLDDQNKKTIWGQYFPEFNNHEDRFLTTEEYERIISNVGLDILEIIKFEHKRKSTLTELIEKVENHHYSTFSFYESEELKDAIQEFKGKLIKKYPIIDHDPSSEIKHTSPMSLIVIKKT